MVSYSLLATLYKYTVRVVAWGLVNRKLFNRCVGFWLRDSCAKWPGVKDGKNDLSQRHQLSVNHLTAHPGGSNGLTNKWLRLCRQFPRA